MPCEEIYCDSVLVVYRLTDQTGLMARLILICSGYKYLIIPVLQIKHGLVS